MTRDNLNLWLPSELVNAVRAKAKDERRTIISQVTVLLEKALAAEEESDREHARC
jgi:hypothetical protein